MSRTVFETKRTDAAGRLGRLEIPRADVTIETPAMLPVVNPHLQLIDPSRLAETFGAEILITNAYVLYQSDDLRETVLEKGIHDLLEFPGAVMTDSGSFQLAEYGEIDVTTEDILTFQDRIGSDIATPVDVPTPPDAERQQTEADLTETEAAIRTAATYEGGDMLCTAPVQGSTYPDLREQAARTAYAQELDLYPIGAVVPLLRAYRFGDVVEVIEAAKQGLGRDAPVHLFGAGHPMMFSLGVALGCDLFDSAAYALYAREGRYLTTGGTQHLEDLSYLPCQCPVCTETSPDALRNAPEERQERLLSEHNLHVTFGEIRRVKQALLRGELLELVERRVRAHPQLLEGYRRALAQPERLLEDDPVTSHRPMFYVSSESAARPEVRRHHERLSRLSVPDKLVLVDRAIENPGAVVAERVDSTTPRWSVAPPFGPIPPALEQTYPLTAERPTTQDHAAIERAVDGIRHLVRAHEVDLTLIHDGWAAQILEKLPSSVRTIRPPLEAPDD